MTALATAVEHWRREYRPVRVVHGLPVPSLLLRLARRFRRAAVVSQATACKVAMTFGPRDSRRGIASIYVADDERASWSTTGYNVIYVSPCGRGRRRAARELASRTGGQVWLVSRRGRVVDIVRGRDAEQARPGRRRSDT